jgi:hypothetical protein
MTTTIPTTGQISIKQIREYIGLNNKVHFTDETNPLSLKQVFFSPTGSTNLSNANALPLSYLRGCKFAAYVNSARSLAAGSALSNRIDGTQELWFGLSNPVQNSGYGQSGLLYTRNLGLPIKLHIQATSGNLNSLSLDTYSRANNSFNSYLCGSQGGASFEVVNDLHQIRLYTDINSLSEFIIRIIPMLDGGTEGTGEHVISMSLIYIDKEESSSEFIRR